MSKTTLTEVEEVILSHIDGLGYGVFWNKSKPEGPCEFMCENGISGKITHDNKVIIEYSSIFNEYRKQYDLFDPYSIDEIEAILREATDAIRRVIEDLGF